MMKKESNLILAQKSKIENHNISSELVRPDRLEFSLGFGLFSNESIHFVQLIKKLRGREYLNKGYSEKSSKTCTFCEKNGAEYLMPFQVTLWDDIENCWSVDEKLFTGNIYVCEKCYNKINEQSIEVTQKNERSKVLHNNWLKFIKYLMALLFLLYLCMFKMKNNDNYASIIILTPIFILIWHLINELIIPKRSEDVMREKISSLTSDIALKQWENMLINKLSNNSTNDRITFDISLSSSINSIYRDPKPNPSYSQIIEIIKSYPVYKMEDQGKIKPFLNVSYGGRIEKLEHC